MILWFSGTGNSLAIARRLATDTGDTLMSLYDAVRSDLSKESTIGLVYPSYYFNPPQAVTALVERLSLPRNAYVFIVITCGAQTGNSVWAVERILRKKGLKVAYCHKIRVPDCSAIGFGRDPNMQKWKFERYASRLDVISSHIKAKRHSRYYGAPGLAGWICALPCVRRSTLPLLQPAVDKHKCIGCSVCMKVCPQGNIRMKEGAKADTGVAYISDRCVQCLSCVHFCPQQAVVIAGKPTPKKHQYHNPQIKIKDLIRR